MYGGEIPPETEHGGGVRGREGRTAPVWLWCRASEASIRRCCRATPVHGPLSPARPHVQSAILPYLHISLCLCVTWIFFFFFLIRGIYVGDVATARFAGLGSSLMLLY